MKRSKQDQSIDSMRSDSSRDMHLLPDLNSGSNFNNSDCDVIDTIEHSEYGDSDNVVTNEEI